MKCVLIPADKAASNAVIVLHLHYIDTLKRELINTYPIKLQASLSNKVVVDGHCCLTALLFWCQS